MRSRVAGRIETQFAVPRRTVIEMSEFEADMEDLIQREDMVVTVTAGGYIKRMPLSTYRAQRRGGKGRSAMAVRDEDITTEAAGRQYPYAGAVFLQHTGQVYKLKVYTPAARRREYARQGAGQRLPAGRKARRSRPSCRCRKTRRMWDTMNIFFATAKGNVRRNDLSDFHDIRANGKIAIRTRGRRQAGRRENLHRERPCVARREIGKCIRFPSG